MKKITNILFVFCTGLSCLCVHSYAQTKSSQALQIGDTVPNLSLSTIINYKKESAHIHDFQGKLLILDFWATTCRGCLASFPKLQHLPETFGDSLEIMLVTNYKDKAYNQAFFDKRKAGGNPVTLPSVVEDTLLSQYFPIDGLPHVVWIDGRSVVRAITNGSTLTEDHVREMLKSVMVPSFRMKKKLVRFDKHTRENPYIIRYPEGKPEHGLPGIRSVFTGYIDTLNRMDYMDHRPYFTRIFFSNSTVPQMIRQIGAFSYFGDDSVSADYLTYKGFSKEQNAYFPYKDFSDFEQVDYTALEEMRRHHFFCYELTLPPSYSMAQAGKWMLQDLERYLAFRIGFKEKSVEVLYLKPIEESDRDTLAHQKAGAAMGQLAYFLNQNKDLPLIIDRTGWKLSGCTEPWLLSSLPLDELTDALKILHLKLERSSVHVQQLIIE